MLMIKTIFFFIEKPKDIKADIYSNNFITNMFMNLHCLYSCMGYAKEAYQDRNKWRLFLWPPF